MTDETNIEVTPEEVEKEKTPKESRREKKLVLTEGIRQSLRSRLEYIGISCDGLSDEDLILKLESQTQNLFEEKVRLQDKDSLKLSLEAYAADTLLTDSEFINRLYMLNVPRIYLGLFRDFDKTMTRAQIWERIRHSPIRPITDVNEIFRVRGKVHSDKPKRVRYVEY